MTSADELVLQASRDLGINRSKNEDEVSWQMRVVYTAIGRQAFASLWDDDANSHNVSITHFKRKIKSLLDAWKDILPKAARDFTIDPDEFADELYQIYENSGSIWHSPNRLSPSDEKRICRGQLRLVRSAKLNSSVQFSGLGGFVLEKDGDLYENYSLFGWDDHTLEELFIHEVKNRKLRKMEGEYDAQYLRIEPPFSRGYWKLDSEKVGVTSLMRIGQPGNYTYYLYQNTENGIEVHQFQRWKTEGHNYRNISVPILYKKGTLPEIEYAINDNLVTVKQKYLLPPAELNYLILYSWPTTYRIAGANFERIMCKSVFDDFKEILERKGFKFKEV